MADAVRHWLMKTEPGTYGIDRMAAEGRTGWDGVRNARARNHMQEMSVGDAVLFYHSSCKPPGVAGLCRVVAEAHPDPTQFDRASPYFDKRASDKNVRWHMVDVEFVAKFDALLSLDALKADAALDGLLATKRGMRLSVQPVSPEHYARVVELAGAA